MRSADRLHVSSNTNENLPDYPLSDYVGGLKDKLQTCYELVRESMNVEQEKQKTYYDRSAIGPQYDVGDLVMLFNPTKKKPDKKM